MVILRDACDDDEPALRRLAAASIVYAGDLLPAEDGELPNTVAGAEGVRVAEDDGGPVGMYVLSVRRVYSNVEAVLTGMLVARRARHWAVDRLLVVDLQQQAAHLGAHVVTVLARPPVDVLFRRFGARAVGLAAPWGSVPWPRVHLELPVPGRPA